MQLIYSITVCIFLCSCVNNHSKDDNDLKTESTNKEGDTDNMLDSNEYKDDKTNYIRNRIVVKNPDIDLVALLLRS